jgi:hypothetical protein
VWKALPSNAIDLRHRLIRIVRALSAVEPEREREGLGEFVPGQDLIGLIDLIAWDQRCRRWFDTAGPDVSGEP